MDCAKCGKKDVKTSYVEPVKSQMIRRQYCWDCNYWRDQIDEMKVNFVRVLIIKGKIYGVGPEDSKSMFRGFGGREFMFRRFGSDEVETTTNLWAGQVIPDEFRDELPDNAEFVKDMS